MGQATTQGERWFGRSVEELAIDTGSTPNRNIHWEEARIYYFKITAGASGLTVTLPTDVRNHPIGGPYLFVKVDSASTKSVSVEDQTGGIVATISAGFVAVIWLTDNSVAEGVWQAHLSPTTPGAVYS